MQKIGIDIIEIDRIKSSCENFGDKFLKRVFTKDEIGYCYSKKDPYPHLAARFSAKEAFMKAMGRGMTFNEIEVYFVEDTPSIRLHGESLSLFKKNNVMDISLSISHSRDNAVAVVIIMSEGKK
jgi:holo-[acyl-carrier protein] synthase